MSRSAKRPSTAPPKSEIILAVPVGPRLAPGGGVRLAPLAVLAAVSGCFYTEVINLPPQAQIERVSPELPVKIRGEVALTARGSVDDNGDALAYDWKAQTCAACVAYASDSTQQFRVPVRDHDSIRVTLVVTDAHGASSVTTAELHVQNALPTVQIQAQAQGGEPKVTREIAFVAQGADEDGDALTYEFAVFPPAGSPAGYVFRRESATSSTLIPDRPGTWEVQVTVDDGHGGRTTGSRMVTVAADEPPCIAATTPTWTPDARVILLRGGGPRRFSVDSVADDLDPWPGSSSVRFRWLVGPPDAPAELAGHDLPDLVLDPADLDPGDELAVRVEVSDRQPRVLPCDVGQAVCPTVACAQRLTWRAEVR
jgi:hypothetical protein